MRVRTYGLILLGLAGILPLATYGYRAIEESRGASKRQFCTDNGYLAKVIVERVQAYADMELDLLESIGIGTLQSRDPGQTLMAFALGSRYAQFQQPAVYRGAAPAGGDLRRIAGAAPEGKDEVYRELARRAFRSGSRQHSELESTSIPNHGPVQAVIMATPIKLAGKRVGAVVATYDTVGMWKPVNTAKIGRTGYAGLVTPSGRLLAHGNTDERRGVFDPEERDQRYQRIVDRLRSGRNERNCQQYDDKLVSAALGHFFANRSPGGDRAAPPGGRAGGDGIEWYVMVERSTGEAFAEVRALTDTLLLVGAGVLVLVIALSLLGGRVLVGALESLGAHARSLGKNLATKRDFASEFVEIGELAKALDDMAADLIKQRTEARAREQLTTFAGVSAGLAHDLRLPIETVLGACTEIQADPSNAYARELLRKVTERDLPRLQRYIDDLRRLAVTGELALEYTSVELDTLFEDVCNELAAKPSLRDVGFEPDGRGRAVSADENLIRRAVLNLVENAAAACLRKGRGNRVKVDVIDSNDEGFLEIRVIDNGIGISPAELESLKDGDFHSSKRAGGFGLGLGWVRRIAAAHGGELLISSKVGKGSTFSLRLPRT